MIEHLDNPIWHALTSVHEPLCRANGLARRYVTDVSPLSALESPSAAAFADLRSLVVHGESVALLSPAPLDVPPDWQLLKARYIDQMICPELTPAPSLPCLTLQHADVPDMLSLTAATQPGPFLPGTIRMGRYIGIRSDDGRLAAMAGQRLKSESFTEISAVCTDPAFRGRGYAAGLMSPLVQQALDEGKLPFLHVKTENSGAKAVYQRLGFRIRREIWFMVLAPA